MFKKFFLIFCSMILFLSLVCFQAEIALAGAGDNVSGWAWSSNIGYIAFNCNAKVDTNNDRIVDEELKVCDGGENANKICNSGYLEAVPCGAGASCELACNVVDFGVNINIGTGIFSGYAWSSNIGWISFADFDGDGDVDTDDKNIVDSPCSPNCEAKIVGDEVSGWARALAYGGDWDGWISLKGAAQNGDPYGVVRSGCDLTEYAWGSDVIGWIKFKGIAHDGSSYGVTTEFCGNKTPSADTLTSTQPNYCVSGPAATFSWNFIDEDAGDYQTAYQVQVDDNSDFSSLVYDTNKVTSGSESCSTGLGVLSYHSTYYWRLRVWDSQDATSTNWIDGLSFNTPNHTYPTVNFDWIPLNPAVDEEVDFTDHSIVGDGATIISWDWTFQDGNPATSIVKNPENVKFFPAVPKSKSVSLKVVDSDGYSCTKQKFVELMTLAPKWKEMAP